MEFSQLYCTRTETGCLGKKCPLAVGFLAGLTHLKAFDIRGVTSPGETRPLEALVRWSARSRLAEVVAVWSCNGMVSSPRLPTPKGVACGFTTSTHSRSRPRESSLVSSMSERLPPPERPVNCGGATRGSDRHARGPSTRCSPWTNGRYWLVRPIDPCMCSVPRYRSLPPSGTLPPPVTLINRYCGRRPRRTL